MKNRIYIQTAIIAFFVLFCLGVVVLSFLRMPKDSERRANYDKKATLWAHDVFHQNSTGVSCNRWGECDVRIGDNVFPIQCHMDDEPCVLNFSRR